MLVLGIESSCDETGVALYDSVKGLLAHRLHSQIELHAEYGGVVPELASRDHIRRLIPLLRETMKDAGKSLGDLDGIACTEGPGLAGALLVGAGFGRSLAHALRIPAVGIHHLEGHLLSPLLTAPAPAFPFIALLVSGGHTQLMQVDGIGRYRLLGDTLDDAAGEAFDKSAKLMGLGYPGGPAIAALAERGTPGSVKLPRPLLHSRDLHFSFSGLKTAVLTAVRSSPLDEARMADLAAELQAAIVEVLVSKSLAALDRNGLRSLVVAGGVGANRALRAALTEQAGNKGYAVFYPPLDLCTDNGAMIAHAGALRLSAGTADLHVSPAGFSVRPRWDLAALNAA
jgi:N6-L-threonylcarbamoyladenine synthase